MKNPLSTHRTNNKLLLKVNTVRQARYSRLVQNEQHVNSRHRLRREFRRSYPNLSFVSCTLLLECQLHVAVTGCETVSVVITPKHYHGRNLTGITADSYIEMAAVRDLLR